jgi:hypothetical protein
MRARYRHIINVYHWDEPSNLVHKFSIPTSLKNVSDLQNINSDKLPKDFPFDFPSIMEKMVKKPKRSDGFNYKIVIKGSVSFDGKAFGRCTGIYLTSGRIKSQHYEQTRQQ